jgi:hypothetical protein
MVGNAQNSGKRSKERSHESPERGLSEREVMPLVSYQANAEAI